MIGNVISYVLNNLPGFLLVIALICAAIPTRRPPAARFLNWILLLPVGIGTLWAAVFHLAFPALAAKYIGWQNSPFQFEVGTADLAFGILGVVSFWAGMGFKTATVLAISIFLLGDAAGHIHQMMLAGNFAPGNAGLVFYMDIILPLLSGALLLAVQARRDYLP
jgi:hypothetical protein